MHYVIGDIHGQIDALKILLHKLNLKEDDKVYFVGDWFDREYTMEDRCETAKWMLENLKEHSQFISVMGNHDLEMLQTIQHGFSDDIDDTIFWDGWNFMEPKYMKEHYSELSDLMKRFPLYESIVIEDKEFLVTHSWIVDKNGRPIGMKEFDISNTSQEESVWDRKFSLQSYECEMDIPVIIHGHTPTLKDKEMVNGKWHALAKIEKIGRKNINVDCCAFYGPMRGGNLAAYRCEDGAEFYAYDDELFYTLVDKCCDELSYGERAVFWYEWYFAFMFYGAYTDAILKDSDDFVFENSRAKEAYDKVKSVYADIDDMDELRFEVERKFRYVKNKIHNIVPSYWVKNRILR